MSTAQETTYVWKDQKNNFWLLHHLSFYKLELSGLGETTKHRV